MLVNECAKCALKFCAAGQGAVSQFFIMARSLKVFSVCVFRIRVPIAGSPNESTAKDQSLESHPAYFSLLACNQDWNAALFGDAACASSKPSNSSITVFFIYARVFFIPEFSMAFEST